MVAGRLDFKFVDDLLLHLLALYCLLRDSFYCTSEAGDFVSDDMDGSEVPLSQLTAPDEALFAERVTFWVWWLLRNLAGLGDRLLAHLNFRRWVQWLFGHERPILKILIEPIEDARVIVRIRLHRRYFVHLGKLRNQIELLEWIKAELRNLYRLDLAGGSRYTSQPLQKCFVELELFV